MSSSWFYFSSQNYGISTKVHVYFIEKIRIDNRKTESEKIDTKKVKKK